MYIDNQTNNAERYQGVCESIHLAHRTNIKIILNEENFSSNVLW